MTREPFSPEFGPTPEQLAAFADGELPVPAHEKVQAWLRDRPQAQAEVEALRGFVLGWRSAPLDEPSPEAWDRALAGIASSVPPKGGVAAPKGRWRPHWALRVVGGLLVTAAVLGGVLIARSFWGPRPEVVQPEPGPLVQQGPNEDDEPFAVVSAAEVHVINVRASDADSLVLGQPRFLDSFEFASSKDIQVLAVEPHQADGPMPRLEEGTVPMIVLSPVSVRVP